MTAPIVNDRLYDELLKPIAEEYYAAAKELHGLLSVPVPASSPAALWLQARMEALEEVGDRTARVIEVAAPLWEDMRAATGMTW